MIYELFFVFLHPEMLDAIHKPILCHLEAYQKTFQETMRADNPLLSAALQHISLKKGKLMRPSLVLLCAEEGGCVDEAVMHAAVALELLHTASLVHDDVVDESMLRRGQRSVNAIWDNKAAVLVGDFMTSSVLAHAVVAKRIEVVERIAWLGQTLADGELLQLNNTTLTDFSEETYWEVIRKKTASLFSSCAWMGAFLGKCSKTMCQQLEEYGALVGLCFQIRDDLFDYDEQLEVGKPKGNDMMEGKLTLPVLHALNTYEGDKKVLYRQIALKVRQQEATKLEIQQLVAFAREHGGVAYAQSCIENMRKQAFQILSNLKNADVRCALEAYFDYVIGRTL